MSPTPPQTTDGPRIELDRVTKRYGDKVVLSSTTLTIGARRCLALLGPSGCGKSTVLRIVIGLIRPDEGSVVVLGEPMTPRSASLLRRRIGYVIQDGGLFPHLSAAENAALMARQLGWKRDRVEARLAELAKLVRLDAALLARFPAELSGGQRQRVGIMRALMLDPDLLLLDEPMGALDPMVRARLQEDMKRIFAELEKTVLVVTHDLAEAAYLADEVALMRDGRILQRGPLRELVEAPADPFVAEFLQAQRAPWWSEWSAAG
jgi:osmoprotectant transport system ATP-binding protein